MSPDAATPPSRASGSGLATAGSSAPGWRHPDLAGLTWRPLTPGDLAALTDLVAVCETHDDPPYRTSAAELAQDVFDPAHTDFASGTIGGFDDMGRALAYARVRRTSGSGSVMIGGGIEPALRRRGVGRVLLRWQLERARAIGGGPVVVSTYVEDGMGDHAAMLAEEGFTAQRRFWELRRDLSLPLPESPLRSALRLEAWRPELAEQVRLAHNESFEGVPGAAIATPESWASDIASAVPEWSFVVMDRSTDRTPVAGYLLSGRYEQDWPALGYTNGYVDLLGVRRAYRGQRVASAMLGAAMRAYREAGMEYASLTADSAVDEATSTLYAQLGFEAQRGSTTWAITLD